MAHSPETRFSLIEKIKDPANATAWGEFVAIYEPLIVQTCRRKGLQHADAIDVTQEVLARVAKSIERFKTDQATTTFRGWLYRITRNLTIDFVRRRQNDPLAVQGPEDLNSLPDPTDEESRDFQLAFQKQMFLVVARHVETQVKPQTWAAFWSVDVLERDPADVAKELGMTRGAVYVAKCRVTARLRREVQKRLSETGHHPIDPSVIGDEA